MCFQMEGQRVNVITNGLRQKSVLPPPQPTPFNLQMVDFSFNKPLGINPNVGIRIHCIPYIITFMVMNNKAINPTYSMLLQHPWLLDAKAILDQGTNMVSTKGNVKTIFISNYLNGNVIRSHTVVSYKFIEGVINEGKKILLFYEPNLFSIGMITLPDQAVFEPHTQFHHKLKIVTVDETLAMEKVKTLKIIE